MLTPSKDNPLWHSAFYEFAALADPHAVAQHLKALTVDLCGSILVAPEGINGMVAAPLSTLDTFERHLAQAFDGIFAHMMFKRSPCLKLPFRHMRVKVKREIVPLGVPGVSAVNPKRRAVPPSEWRKLIARDDVVLIDNRNSFEFKLGRFKGAIDPGILHFRDFPRYIEAHLPAWKAQGKSVAMYCTGGIRCEKTSAWMQDMGVDVYDLEGGILNFFKEIPDASRDWQGECFVFDNRVALDTSLKETDTAIEQVYQDEPDREWRIGRAKRHAGEQVD
jgi:UPF0176 protein